MSKSVEYIKIIQEVKKGKRDTHYEPVERSQIKAEIIGEMLGRAVVKRNDKPL